jgi:phospho-N-acetylmuramoyl-pentapeptide-transferase
LLIAFDPSSAKFSFWIAFAASAIGAYPIFRLLLALKSRQTVSQYAPEGHQLKQGTPTMGGIIVVFGLLLAVLANWLRDGTDNSHWLAVGALILAFALIGFVDDFVVPRLIKGKRGLGWKQKIVLELLASFLGVWALGVPLASFKAGLVVFFILFFSNAYNFSDGLDGLAGTLGVLIFTGLGAFALALGSPDLSSYAILVGAMLPFLMLNAPPAKLFMGDVGSLPIGAFMGFLVTEIGLASDGTGSATKWIALAILSLVMIAELVPVPLQIFSVKVFKRRIFPYTPIHHAFEKAGWKETKVVFLFALVQILCIAGALSLLNGGGAVYDRVLEEHAVR